MKRKRLLILKYLSDCSRILLSRANRTTDGWTTTQVHDFTKRVLNRFDRDVRVESHARPAKSLICTYLRSLDESVNQHFESILLFSDIDPTQVFQTFFNGGGGGHGAEFNFGGFPGGFSFQFG